MQQLRSESAAVAFCGQNVIILINLPSTYVTFSIQENTMKQNEFRSPLLKSAAILIGTIILATIAASAGGDGTGGGFLAFIAGIGHTVLFIIGLQHTHNH